MTSKYVRPIRRGEYDLANISLVGHDPVDGRSYDECHDEWRQAFEATRSHAEAARWWQLRQRLRSRWRLFALATHLGMR